MGRMELQAQDALDRPSGEAHGNVTGETIGTKRALHVKALGNSGITDISGDPVIWDTLSVDNSGTDSTVYTYFTNGTDSQLVITVTYTDTTKETISTVVKTEP